MYEKFFLFFFLLVQLIHYIHAAISKAEVSNHHHYSRIIFMDEGCLTIEWQNKTKKTILKKYGKIFLAHFNIEKNRSHIIAFKLSILLQNKKIKLSIYFLYFFYIHLKPNFLLISTVGDFSLVMFLFKCILKQEERLFCN